ADAPFPRGGLRGHQGNPPEHAAQLQPAAVSERSATLSELPAGGISRPAWQLHLSWPGLKRGAPLCRRTHLPQRDHAFQIDRQCARSTEHERIVRAEWTRFQELARSERLRCSTPLGIKLRL